MALEKELEAYQNQIADSKWVAQNQGRYVLVKDDKVIQAFDSYGDALRGGYDRFGLEPFLVKQVSAIEQTHFIARLSAPCLTSPSQ